MLKPIIRRVHNDRSLSDTQREENLGDCRLPHRWGKQQIPIRFKKEHDSIDGTLKRRRTTQDYDHNDVWENCQEICHFSGTPNTPDNNQVHNRPGGKQT